ncbi:MAG: ribonuclease P protein component [Acidimicrobiales bacterium]
MGRVRSRSTFAAIRRGRRRRSGPLTVSWSGDGSPDPPCVAFAIGRKVGPAVRRNRLRRRLRAILAADAPRLAPGAYLVNAAPGADTLSFDELRTNLMHALESLAALVDAPAPAERPHA